MLKGHTVFKNIVIIGFHKDSGGLSLQEKAGVEEGAPMKEQRDRKIK